ncbi:hypothetical protein [Actinokineospora sp.]|uniref:hypothetical protein n=1 Tax=Actinokineospora sp. TaxID=1872133 RepID=UPI003D6BEDBE
MTTDHTHAEYANTSAVAGLAREVETLRRAIRKAAPVQDAHAVQLHKLAGQLDELAQATARKGPADKVVAPSWLSLPSDADAVAEVLDELLTWLCAVYLRYADAAASLSDCWLWHPEVVEELVWLMHTWIAAYEDENASATAAGDWHDRYRPGVVRRIKTAIGTCSLENHTSPQPAPRVPLVEAAEAIVTWWGTARTAPAPEPTDAHLAAATPAPSTWGNRR